MRYRLEFKDTVFPGGTADFGTLPVFLCRRDSRSAYVSKSNETLSVV